MVRVYDENMKKVLSVSILLIVILASVYSIYTYNMGKNKKIPVSVPAAIFTFQKGQESSKFLAKSQGLYFSIEKEKEKSLDILCRDKSTSTTFIKDQDLLCINFDENIGIVIYNKSITSDDIFIEKFAKYIGVNRKDFSCKDTANNEDQKSFNIKTCTNGKKEFYFFTKSYQDKNTIVFIYNNGKNKIDIYSASKSLYQDISNFKIESTNKVSKDISKDIVSYITDTFLKKALAQDGGEGNDRPVDDASNTNTDYRCQNGLIVSSNLGCPAQPCSDPFVDNKPACYCNPPQNRIVTTQSNIVSERYCFFPSETASIEACDNRLVTVYTTTYICENNYVPPVTPAPVVNIRFE